MKKQSSLLCLFFVFCSFSYGQVVWDKLGSDIDGEGVSDASGYSISMNSLGDRIIIGAYQNKPGSKRTGHARIYVYNDTLWTQLGGDINGVYEYDQFGYSVSMNSLGDYVVIGANGFGNTNIGKVTIYNYNINYSSNWLNRGSINGEYSQDNFGKSVSINAIGDRVAIGGPYNDGNGSNSGHVRVFKKDGTWNKLGSDIDGESVDDQSGHFVSLNSVGDRVAIGAPYNDGNGSNSGHVRVYSYDGSSWNQLGSDIDGESIDDQSGFSVSLNDLGDILAIGAPYNDGNGSNSGHVRVYSYDGSNWNQLGSDIDGESIDDQSGFSVSINGIGDRVAIGAPKNDGNSSNSGHVRVYNYNGTSWIQLGANINGETILDKSGHCVTMNNYGGSVGIGAPWNDGSFNGAGHVRIYSRCANQTTYGIDTQIACYSYTWIDGITYKTSNNTAMDTIANKAGCDSVVTLNLTILDTTKYNQVLYAKPINSVKMYGASVTVSGSNAIIGSQYDNAAYMFKKVGGVWTETQTITASDDSTANVFGSAVSISGDKALVEGKDQFVYAFELIAGVWVETQKLTASDGCWGDYFGDRISISGNRAIIGSFYSSLDASGPGVPYPSNCCTWTCSNHITHAGVAYIFDYNNGVWTETQKIFASDFGMIGDYFGSCVSISGDVAIIGATGNDGATGDINNNNGAAYFFELINGSWTETQKVMGSYTNVNNNFGRAVFISGDRAIVGDNKHAYIYEKSNGVWANTQKLTSSDSSNHYLYNSIGKSVSISGNTAIIGVYDSYFDTDGSVYIFKLRNGVWAETQKLSPLTSDNYAAFGSSISISGNSVIVGCPQNDSTGSAYFYDYKSEIDSQIACTSYTWIDGVTYTSSNSNAVHTLTNVSGCDSIVTLDLTIMNSTTGTDVQTVCGNYTWTDGVTYTSSNNTATDTLTSVSGCDSIVALDLTIMNSTTGTDVQTACGSYTWTDGVKYTSSNNTATDTITNVSGCDSIITLDLTIMNSTSGTDVQTVCGNYTWTNGVTYTSSNNTAKDTITNVSGCDSIVILDLTIINNINAIDTQTSCGGYNWNGTIYSSSGTYTEVFTAANGCDSTVELSLTILFEDSSNLYASICYGDSLSFGSQMLTSSGTYTETYTASNGCDSTVELILSVNTQISLGVTKTDVTSAGGSDGSALVSASGGTAPYSYQWNDSLQQTTANAVGLSAGSYSLIVTDSSGCSDTISVSIDEPVGCFGLTSSNTDASTNVSNDGTANVTVSGGTPPYTYTWYRFENFDSEALCGNTSYSCVYDGSCPLSSNFWSNDSDDSLDILDWSVNKDTTLSAFTGPSADHTTGYGNYLFTESSNCYTSRAFLQSIPIDLTGTSSPELSFYYNLNGIDIGGIYVNVKSETFLSWQFEFAELGNQGDVWKKALVDLSAYSGDTAVVVAIRGLTGSAFKSDIAIDDISFKLGLDSAAGTGLSAGIYKVMVSDTSGCLDSVEVVIGSGTVTSNEYISTIDNNKLNIYPNPFSNSTIIAFDNPEQKNYQLNVYDVLGNRVRVINNITSNRVELKRENLISGIYFIELHFGNERIRGNVMIE